MCTLRDWVTQGTEQIIVCGYLPQGWVLYVSVVDEEGVCLLIEIGCKVEYQIRVWHHISVLRFESFWDIELLEDG